MVTSSADDFENVVHFVRAIRMESAVIQLALNIHEPAISDAYGRSHTLAVQINVLVGHIDVLVQM